MMSNNAGSNDNRKAVRASDRILFSFRPVDQGFYRKLVEDYKRGISLYHQENIAELQMFAGAQGALDRLADRDEDMAAVLRMLDRKLNFLIQKGAASSSPLEGMRMHEVNISGAGLAFASNEPFSPGTMLELYLILLPDYTFVYAIGEVVNSERGEGAGYRTAVKFSLIQEEDRERLIQHNFKQQSLALRNRRLNS